MYFCFTSKQLDESLLLLDSLLFKLLSRQRGRLSKYMVIFVYRFYLSGLLNKYFRILLGCWNQVASTIRLVLSLYMSLQTSVFHLNFFLPTSGPAFLDKHWYSHPIKQTLVIKSMLLKLIQKMKTCSSSLTGFSRKDCVQIWLEATPPSKWIRSVMIDAMV